MDKQYRVPGSEMTRSNVATERNLYRICGVAVFFTVLVMVLEMAITFFPGGSPGDVEVMTVEGWFDLFRESRFMGLRNLGLMNMLSILFAIPVYLALYWIHRKGYRAFAALAAVLYFIGISIYLAGNSAFSMLSLSRSYAAAASETERTMILAAGRALLAWGEGHTAGTFVGFLFIDSAGIAISIVMLQARIFSRVAGYAGIFGYLFLLLYDIFCSFIPAFSQGAMVFVLIGGPLSLLWDVLIGIRFLRIGFEKKTEI